MKLIMKELLLWNSGLLLVVPEVVQTDPLGLCKGLPLCLRHQLAIHTDHIRILQLNRGIVSPLVVAPLLIADDIARLLRLEVLGRLHNDDLRHIVLLRAHGQVLLLVDGREEGRVIDLSGGELATWSSQTASHLHVLRPVVRVEGTLLEILVLSLATGVVRRHSGFQDAMTFERAQVVHRWVLTGRQRVVAVARHLEF